MLGDLGGGSRAPKAAPWVVYPAQLGHRLQNHGPSVLALVAAWPVGLERVNELRGGDSPECGRVDRVRAAAPQSSDVAGRELPIDQRGEPANQGGKVLMRLRVHRMIPPLQMLLVRICARRYSTGAQP